MNFFRKIKSLLSNKTNRREHAKDNQKIKKEAPFRVTVFTFHLVYGIYFTVLYALDFVSFLKKLYVLFFSPPFQSGNVQPSHNVSLKRCPMYVTSVNKYVCASFKRQRTDYIDNNLSF